MSVLSIDPYPFVTYRIPELYAELIHNAMLYHAKGGVDPFVCNMILCDTTYVTTVTE